MYSNLAVVELSNFSMDRAFWQNMYPALEQVSCNYDLYG